MIYLLLSILTSSSLFVIFKYFEKLQINTLQAIIINYGVACISGFIAYGKFVKPSTIINFDWFPFTLILGIVFITIFNFMGITAQKNGLSVVAVASIMSVIIPIIYGVVIYKEQLGVQKTIGILLALIAIYLVCVNPKNIKKEGKLIFPVLVFIGSGFIDTFLNVMETHYLKDNEVAIFSACTFLIAFCAGLIIILYQIINGKFNFEIKNLIGGTILGIVNYFSIFFLIKAISQPNLESSTLFTINNVSILIVTSIFGLVFFKEKLSKQNQLGIVLACLGIILVSLSI